MIECVELIRLTENPTARRLWLLVEALQCLPLGRAIGLARSAEEFLTGSAAADMRQSERPASEPVGPVERDRPLTDDLAGSPPPVAAPAAHRTNFALTDEQRNQLLDRLAGGARNAELAAEFGISSRQIQGLRMGCARDIVERRARLSTQPAEPEQPPAATGSIDEISPAATTSIDSVVRFLRQQDDVVVPQRDGEYLINGRFRMSAAELIARANRMRERQRKQPFEVSSLPIHPTTIAPSTGHPLFWEGATPSNHASNGFASPKNHRGA
jgi:hypothetical protein